MSKRFAGLGSQTILLAASTGVSQVILALVYVYAANHLEPSRFGQVAVAITIGLTANGLLDYGLTYYCTRELAAQRITPREASARFASKLLVTAALALTATAILHGTLLATCGVIMATAALNQCLHVALRSASLSHFSGLVQLLERLVLAALFFAFVHAGIDEAQGLWMATAASALVGACAAYVVTPNPFKLSLAGPVRNPWAGCGQFGLYGLATTGAGLELPLFAWQAGSALAGVYATVNRWVAPLVLLGNAFSTAALPIMSKSPRPSELWHAVRRSLWLLMAGIGACSMVAIFSAEITSLLLGDEYSEAASALQLLALAAAISVVNQPLATWLIASGLEGKVAAATTVGTVVQLTICVTTVSILGIRAPGAGLLASQLVLLTAIAITLTARFHDSNRVGRV